MQLKELTSNNIVSIAQLSVEPLSICAGVIVAAPVASRFTDMFCVITIGAVLSFIVTIAVPVELLPLVSVTVSVTEFAPMLAQVKVVWLKTLVAIPQLSVDPLSIWPGVIIALPLASRFTEMFCVATTGAVVSARLTATVSLSLHPFGNVAVKV